MTDPDRAILLPNSIDLAQAGARQTAPKYYQPNLDPGGLPVVTRINLPAGLYEFHQMGLLPIALRIHETFDELALSGLRREGEVLNLARPRLIRIVEPGDIVSFFPFISLPFLVPMLGATLLARATTEAG